MMERQPAQREMPAIVGEEELNPQALAAIERTVGADEKVLAYSGFDWENKVIAITDRRVLVGGSEGTLDFNRRFIELTSVNRQGRTLVLGTRTGSANYRMGNEADVAEIEYMINNLMGKDPAQETQQELRNIENTVNGDLPSPNIAERVKFWEEQDKINQELIPRVIRQNELLTSHIADHENLPLVAGNAISEALAEARQQQQAQHDAEMAELRAEAEEQRRQHATELQAAQEERRLQGEALTDAKAAAEEQARQHQAELAEAKAEREEQSRQHSDQVTTLQGQLRQAKIQLLMVAGGAVVVAIAGVIIGILV